MKKQWILGAAAAMALLGVGQAQAQTPAVQPAQDDMADATGGEIVVIGEGETRQVQSLGAETLQDMPAGTSPIKLVQRLPGVSYSGADSFGAYEWAVRINVRGFAQQQLGFTLDGLPLGDMSYGNHNGLHISRALISENLGSVELSQGSGALDAASTGRLGGALRFFSLDPAADFGGVAALTIGEENMARGYGRLETGEIAGLGTRAFASFVEHSTDKWKGEGEQNQRQYAFKIVQPIADATVTAYWNRSERREQDYQDFSLEMFNRLGHDWDNFGDSRYALAVQVADIAHNRGDTGLPPTNPGAGTVYPGPIRTVDDAYWDAAGIRDDDLAYVAVDLPIGDNLDLRLQAYTHQNEGQGLWGTPYLQSPNAQVPGATTNNAPLSVRTTEYDIDRNGLIGSATLTLGDHTINGGFWIEQNDAQQARRFYGVDRGRPSRSFDGFQRNPFFTQWAYAFDTQTTVFHLQDTWQATEALKLNFGFRSIQVENGVKTLTINNAAPTPGNSNLVANLETDESFLPQIGANYRIDDNTEVFGSYSENVSAFVSAVTTGPFASRSQANVDEVRRTLKPESAQTFEGGVRHRGENYSVGIAGYIVNFQDRILAVTQGAGIVGNAPVLSNVGGVETQGIELVGQYNLDDNWQLAASYTWNRSRYQDNVVNRAGALLAATKDREVVNTPETLFFGEISYDDGALFGAFSVNTISDRFFTFTNQGGSVDGRTLFDLNAGYRFSGNPLLDGLELQLNIANLFDEEHIGTLGTNGFVNAGDSQTLIAGPPRQVFLSVRKAF
jgi:iron complex outermembrane receptor protein